MKSLFALLAAAGLFVGCSQEDQGATGMGTDTTTGTSGGYQTPTPTTPSDSGVTNAPGQAIPPASTDANTNAPSGAGVPPQP